MYIILYWITDILHIVELDQEISPQNSNYLHKICVAMYQISIQYLHLQKLHPSWDNCDMTTRHRDALY